MKVVSLPQSESVLIQKAIEQDSKAQKALFEHFAPKMLSVCRQYIADYQYAEDAMVKGFTKAFKALGKFDITKKFEPWLHRIMINESITFLRNRQFSFTEPIDNFSFTTDMQADATLNEDDIQFFLDQLPQGYRAVFLLYAIEGYKHHEIAQMLDISEGTSKSQLFKAREFLKEKLQFEKHLSYGK